MSSNKNKSKLSRHILIGLISGIALGIILGDHTGFPGIAGDAFIGLLQMTVLPFIVVALLVNIGRLSLSEGKTLVLTGLKFL